MKNTALMILVLIPLWIFAQGVQPSIPGDPIPVDEYEETEELDWGLSARIGTVTHDGLSFSQVRLFPQLSIGKFGFGLDLDLLFTAEGKIYEENWDEFQDYIDKIFFIRYGGRKDPFYFKAGCIADYTLGHGLIFDHYSNMLRYPTQKNVGAYFGINTPFSGAGLEAFTHNLHQNQILAARIHVNPLDFSQVPLLKDIKIGANIGIDRNQYGKYKDRDKDGIPDVYDKFPKDARYYLDTDDDGIPDELDTDINGTGGIDHPALNPYVDECFPGIADYYPDFPFNTNIVQDIAHRIPKNKSIRIYSLDFLFPLVDTERFSLDSYGEYATIDGFGTGAIFPGFSTHVSIFDLKLELRHFSDEFIPGYFDRVYDEHRSRVHILEDSGRNIYSLYGKDDLLRSSRSGTGWFGYMRINIADLGYFKTAYQDLYGQSRSVGKSWWMNLVASPKAIEKLKEAGIYYSQSSVPYIDFLHPRNSAAALAGRLVYAVSEGVDLIARYSETYSDVNCDGKIKGDAEIVSSFGINIEFSF